MNKAKEIIELLREGFSSDANFWFDKLADISQTEGFSNELINWALGRPDPTKPELEKLKSLLKAQDIPVMTEVLKFIDNIEKGVYKKEFTKTFGEHSQVSEFFSLLSQAILYYE